MKTSTAERLEWQAPTTAPVPQVEPEPQDLAACLAGPNGQELEVQLVHPVPERRIGHARALGRVLLNLATNAVKFTEAGFVEIAARPVGATRLEFSVRDSGEGIDAAVLPTLYQPFRKGATGPRYYFSSSGLGLAICRNLVHAMGSQLRIETRPHWGTRFSFELELPAATV